MKKLLAIDGNNIVNRAFYGVGRLSNSKGMPTNALFGLITIIEHWVEELKPDYCVVALDMDKPTFRHIRYQNYKGTRKPMDENLRVQMPYVRRTAEALGILPVGIEGYEADDILGCASRMAGEENIESYILSGDRDTFQLIDDKTTVIFPSKNDYFFYTKEKFREEYGFDPAGMIDLKAIMGDTSDNIPGVPGIGEKGAKELIGRYGTLDAVYAAIPSDMKPGTVKKLSEGKNSAYESRDLVTILRDVPGMPSLDEMAYHGVNRKEARELFAELEFAAFISRFGIDNPEESTDIPEFPEDEGRLLALIESGCALSISQERVYACRGGICASGALSDALIGKVAENALKIDVWDCKELYKFADSRSYRIRNVKNDVMLALYVADPKIGSDLNKAVTSVIGEIRNPDAPDAYYIDRLAEIAVEKLTQCGGEKLYRETEMPLAAVLTDMEEKGFLIDLEGMSEYGRKLENDAEALKQSIYFAAGEEFNINSPKQLGEVLFDRMGLPPFQKKKAGKNWSTAADILNKLAYDYPIVDDILEYRKLMKLIGTYVVGLAKEADENGVVHTSFRQTGTVTGRLSSAEPNLQNIPVRTDEGRELRRYFTARPGHILIDADYSQIELRLLAAISGDEHMIGAFNSGADIHRSTAAAVFHVPEESVTPEMRKKAKAVNFGIVYGIGEYSLSEDIHSTIQEAKKYIADYLARYSGVAAYLDGAVAGAKEKGYTETVCGRRRYIPELSSSNAVERKFGERVAMNSPIQGSAADIIKIAMINVSRRLKEEKLDASLILQVHDELIIDAAEDDAEKAERILREEMENVFELSVRLTVDVEKGFRWLE